MFRRKSRLVDKLISLDVTLLINEIEIVSKYNGTILDVDYEYLLLKIKDGYILFRLENIISITDLQKNVKDNDVLFN